MDDFNKLASQLLQRNIDETRAQMQNLRSSIKNAPNPEMKKYLNSVNKALKASEALDSFVLKKVSSPPVKTSFVGKIAKFLKRIF